MNKLIGILITELSQIDEVMPFSNAVAFRPSDGAEMLSYLNKIDNRLTPVIIVDHFFIVDGKYKHGHSRDLYNALEQSKHFGRIVFMFDEPMWRARKNEQAYKDVIKVMGEVKLNYLGVEVMHIEAYAELYQQYTENNGKLYLFYDADHIGFDCYGEYGSCGGLNVPELSQFTYLDEIYKAIKNHGSSAKLFLVPGAFTSPNYPESEFDVIKQLQSYMYFFENNFDKVSGLGAFLWGNTTLPEVTIIGARNNELIRKEIEESFPKLGKRSNEFRLILD